ncbi:MAG: hypothetical protein FJ348_06435 [Sphingomonadales bacterium]|nr:hypothetical protein [Sphingomonadales bacterium]
MDGNKDHSEFEHFLKQNADAHRLYPSDRVWSRIYSRMHGRRQRRVALLLLLPLLAGTAWFLSDSLQHRSELSSTGNKTTYSLALTQPSAEQQPRTELQPNAELQPRAELEPNAELQPRAALPLNAVLPPVIELNTVTETQEASVSEEAIPALPQEKTIETLATVASARQDDRYPLDIESVVNSYQRQLHQPRFKWQVHFTPTVSYRSLQEDQKFIAQARMSSAAPASANTNPTDLSSVIRHRPDLGMQIGLTGTYPISKKIDWVTGIQFNVSKYDIAAYNYPSEVATIALMNPWGGTSTVSTLTSFRSSGFRSAANWLRNYYYSVSIPIGLQWRILGKKQTHWGISATAQPTYVVGNRSYVISVDYQNYAEVPYLINKWNLNIGLETYARFQLGKNDFQIGPQIRYQALSSFKKGYPVQEHLYDFGIKLGLILGK